MIVTLVVYTVIGLFLLGFIALVFPDTAYWMMSSVMTPDQIAAGNVTVPYVADPINVIPIIPFVIVGFVIIMMLIVARRY
jgi:hypothetical protein